MRTSHKKGKIEEAKKKVIRQKKEKQIKAVVGLSVDEILEFKDVEEDDEDDGNLRIDEIDLTKDMDTEVPEDPEPTEEEEDEFEDDLDDLEFPDVLEDLDEEDGDK